ncbi:unnamed protein product, partial [Adineta ricciae]
MFKIKRKSQPPTTAPSSSSVSRTTLLVSSPSACSTRHHQKNVSLSSSNSVSPQYSTYQKVSRQRRADEILSNTRSTRPKQFLGYFRCCCYHLCSCTCECSIPSNTLANGNTSSTFTRQNCANHLRGCFVERCFLERKPKQIFLSKLTLFVLLLSSLFPLTFATTLPPSSAQITTVNRDFYVFAGFPLNSSSLAFSLARKPQWHAGCCIRSNKTLSVCNASLNSTFNDILADNFNDNFYSIDFLNDQKLFCQRYNTFRSLTSKQLAVFTYSIVVIGIILNTFVFLVLMCGSLRRSTSFALFLALTCFDLLSLAS